MRPAPEMIPVLIDTAKALKGSRKRLFMARTVQAMGRGGAGNAGPRIISAGAGSPFARGCENC
jgi:hypothetical protein